MALDDGLRFDSHVDVVCMKASRQLNALIRIKKNLVTGDITAHQVLLNSVPEQITEDSVWYQNYY